VSCIFVCKLAKLCLVTITRSVLNMPFTLPMLFLFDTRTVCQYTGENTKLILLIHAISLPEPEIAATWKLRYLKLHNIGTEGLNP
jgi:hypothetical protein